MSWTINNQSPESLNLKVLTITNNSETASEAVLEVAANSYTDSAAFSYGDSITIARNGVNVFTGTVFQTPRNADGSDESLTYTLKDSWYDLERLVYQVPRDYVERITPPDAGDDEDSTLTFVTKHIGTTTFDTGVPLGSRIATIISYAKSKGVNIRLGVIDDGIDWYRTESKDRTCAEMVREFLQMMPDYVGWIDNTSSTPTFNLQRRTSMPANSYTIGQDDVLAHSVTNHDSEKVECVVIRYEKPISVDSENYTEITEDIAPFNADPTKVGTFVETVGLQGGVYQNEYAPIKTDTIPQDDASDDTIKKWWVRYTPELSAIANNHGLNNLLGVMILPDKNIPDRNVIKHHISIVDDGLPSVDPINPNSTPVPKTTNPKDYPRHIIEGVLPDWAGKRYRPILAESTIAVLKSDADAIGDAGLKAAILDIFTVPKTFNSKDYLTALFSAQVMGTNAITKNYKRVVTSDPGETPPTGLAADLLDQLNKTRKSGEISIVGQDPDTTVKVGQRLNIYGGRSSWQTMNESIQQVSHDIQDGITSISFGPPQNLGANDLIDRLRASRVNQFGYRMQSGNDIEEGLGGGSASPIFSFSVQNAVAASSLHPWLVTLSEDGSTIKATILKGKIYNGPLSITEIVPTITVEGVSKDDLVCLEYTYEGEKIKNIVVAEADYEAFTDDGEDPPVIETVVQPIAKIIDVDGVLEVVQIARNNYALTDVCFKDGDDSTPLKYLMPL